MSMTPREPTGYMPSLATLTLRTELLEELMDFLEDAAADHEQHPESCDEGGNRGPCLLQEIVDSIKQDTKNSAAVRILADRYQRMVNRERALLAGLRDA